MSDVENRQWAPARVKQTVWLQPTVLSWKAGQGGRQPQRGQLQERDRKVIGRIRLLDTSRFLAQRSTRSRYRDEAEHQIRFSSSLVMRTFPISPLLPVQADPKGTTADRSATDHNDFPALNASLHAQHSTYSQSQQSQNQPQPQSSQGQQHPYMSGLAPPPPPGIPGPTTSTGGQGSNGGGANGVDRDEFPALGGDKDRVSVGVM